MDLVLISAVVALVGSAFVALHLGSVWILRIAWNEGDRILATLLTLLLIGTDLSVIWIVGKAVTG